MPSLLLFFRTIKHLTPQQVFYRLYYTLRNRLFPKKGYCLTIGNSTRQLSSKNSFIFIPTKKTYDYPGSFTFLNIKHSFSDGIDWNFPGHQKLWAYNLNYFDFLLQPKFTSKDGLELIHKYLADLGEIKIGLEPYPVSLRIMNWVKFCLQHKIDDPQINQAIHGHTKHLSKNLEYHLLANHLFENAFALCFGGLYASDYRLLVKGQKLLMSQLKEQILSDGGHYERSPMYHQIILGRLLDLIQITDNIKERKEWNAFLKSYAGKMLGWIIQVSFNGSMMPLFNDAALGVAPETQKLLEYANKLNVVAIEHPLKESGYRKFIGKKWELLADVGNIAPSYQPGHAHAGTFSFELYVEGKPVIVDTGTSTYNPGERRLLERSTKAHNTVTIGDADSSEVWASHRVGRRAFVTLIKEEPDKVEATHNGYKKYNVVIGRKIKVTNQEVEMIDVIKNTKRGKATLNPLGQPTARLHFHPSRLVRLSKGEIIVDDYLKITFKGYRDIRLSDFKYAPEFNKLIPSTVCEIKFVDRLTTTFVLSIPKN